jgi:hypothetical protein
VPLWITQFNDFDGPSSHATIRSIPNRPNSDVTKKMAHSVRAVICQYEPGSPAIERVIHARYPSIILQFA